MRDEKLDLVGKGRSIFYSKDYDQPTVVITASMILAGNISDKFCHSSWGYTKSSSRSGVFFKAKLYFWTWTRFSLVAHANWRMNCSFNLRVLYLNNRSDVHCPAEVLPWSTITTTLLTLVMVTVRLW